MKHYIATLGMKIKVTAEFAQRFQEGQAKMKSTRAQFLKDRNYHAYLFTFDRAQRIDPFAELATKIEDDYEYWRCLSLVYTSVNAPSAKQFFISAFQAERQNREAFMEKEDQIAFAELPDALTINRGYQKGRARMGLSWTLSKEKAIWFANRFTQLGAQVVAMGTCSKADVFAYCNERKKQEIIIDPKRIVGMQTLKDIGSSEPNAKGGEF